MPAEQALRYPATGGTVEEVLALDPDVVVAGSFIAPATLAALEDRHACLLANHGLIATGADMKHALALAEEMLERTSNSVDEIAADTGFGNAATLRHHFSRARGVSPQAYRRQFSCVPAPVGEPSR